MRDWMTAAEIAGLGLDGLPTTKRNVNLRAVKDLWQQRGEAYARTRAGRGGGWEYHISVLPEAAQADWERRREATLPQSAPVAIEAPVESTTALSARRRRVMEARAQVLTEIRRRMIVDACSQRQAILSLLEAFAIERVLPEAERSLPSSVFNACRDATEKGNGLGRAQVYAWIKMDAEGGIAALAPKSNRPKAADNAWPWIDDLLRFLCQPQKPAMTEAHAALAKYMGAAAPSYAQCRRAIDSLAGTSRWLDRHRGREGRLTLKARLAFKRRDTSQLEPTTVFIADGKTFDAEVAHPFHGRPFKPEITSILDVKTRVCVGWSVGLAETADGVADALRVAVEVYGIPAIFYSDRGSGYRNERMDGPVFGLCARLGTTVTHSLPYNSQARGIIERFNGTVWNPHAERYPSFIGSKMDREAQHRFHKESRSEIATFGAAQNLVGWERFVADAEAAIDAYNNRPHSALRVRDAFSGRWIERSPLEAWEEAESGGFTAFRLDAGETDDLFRPYLIRTARRGEVQFMTNTYFHADLQPYDGLRVLVGYDMHDASKVWVRVLEEDGDAVAMGALICVADFAGNSTHYMPRSMANAATDRRASARKGRLQAKIDEVELEARGNTLIEHAPAEYLTPVPDSAPAVAVTIEADPVVVDLPTAPPRYVDDFALARDIVTGDADLTRGRWELMRDLVRDPAGRELLDYHGIDEASLRAALRASPHATQE